MNTKRHVLVVLGASVVFAVGVTQAQAVIAAAPTWPIPLNSPAAPPPIADLAAAADTPPPADEITDPVTPGALCGDWYLQTSYGDRWPTASVWWEYRCQYAYPQCEGACEANWSASVWIDYFYWDGSQPVFYGEFFGDYYWASLWGSELCDYWWDAPTARWYVFEMPGCPPSANAAPNAVFEASCSGLTCSFDATASADDDGTITGYSWDFGDGNVATGVAAAHTYASSGSYTVTLTVTDDLGATGSASEVVTVEVANTVANTAPVATFTSACVAGECSFDGSGSADSDGAIVSYAWDFGDGSSGEGKLAQHAYAQAGTYAVTLTVTDDAGATATGTLTVLVIHLAASGYRLKGLQKVDLSWNGPSSESFDVYRDGIVIATVTGGAYTDTIGRGAGSYVYKVCARTMDTCSNAATVTF